MCFSCSDKPDKLPSSNQKKKEVKEKEEDEKEDLIETKGLPIDSDSAIIIFTGGSDKDRQFVFVDKRKHSDYLPLITDFDLPTKFEISQYRNSYSDILKKMTENPVEDSYKIDLDDNWLNLKVYDDDYYIYCPAAENQNYRFSLTDSSIIFFTDKGIIADKITGYSKENDKHFVINSVCVTEEGKLISKESNIYLIDSKKHIYIWEVFTPDGLNYKLMIPAKYAKSFPIIVNYGERSTPDEYKFGEINYYEEISKLL
jgi:hypothetical protein